ncbi:hypothetical protein DY000_02032088 [Brassica cretica]|uniref:EMI domain-containing protein n=1 Tax=Brassica cretica TaxID=69181 RepID=A0ABQ7DHJ8_BRACR|nr:hypothetical protein DY000_02032088 [Brassica cretica]
MYIGKCTPKVYTDKYTENCTPENVHREMYTEKCTTCVLLAVLSSCGRASYQSVHQSVHQKCTPEVYIGGCTPRKGRPEVYTEKCRPEVYTKKCTQRSVHREVYTGKGTPECTSESVHRKCTPISTPRTVHREMYTEKCTQRSVHRKVYNEGVHLPVYTKVYNVRPPCCPQLLWPGLISKCTPKCTPEVYTGSVHQKCTPEVYIGGVSDALV